MGLKPDTPEAYDVIEAHDFPEQEYGQSTFTRSIRPNSAREDYLSFDQELVANTGISNGTGTVFIHESEVDDLIVYLTYWKKWRAENAGQTN